MAYSDAAHVDAACSAISYSDATDASTVRFPLISPSQIATNEQLAALSSVISAFRYQLFSLLQVPTSLMHSAPLRLLPFISARMLIFLGLSMGTCLSRAILARIDSSWAIWAYVGPVWAIWDVR